MVLRNKILTLAIAHAHLLFIKQWRTENLIEKYLFALIEFYLCTYMNTIQKRVKMSLIKNKKSTQ